MSLGKANSRMHTAHLPLPNDFDTKLILVVTTNLANRKVYHNNKMRDNGQTAKSQPLVEIWTWISYLAGLTQT